MKQSIKLKILFSNFPNHPKNLFHFHPVHHFSKNNFLQIIMDMLALHLENCSTSAKTGINLKSIGSIVGEMMDKGS